MTLYGDKHGLPYELLQIYCQFFWQVYYLYGRAIYHLKADFLSYPTVYVVCTDVE